MTIRVRNRILMVLLIMTTMLFLGVLAVSIMLPYGSPVLVEAVAQATGHYLGLEWAITPGEIPRVTASALLAGVVAVGSTWIFMYNFRRTTSPELFFLAIFWVSMAVEAARLFNIMGLSAGTGLDTQVMWARLYIFGRLVGSLALFAASLHLAGVGLQFQGSLALGIILVPAAMASLVPIDGTLVRQGLLLASSDAFSVDAASLVFALLTLLNLAKSMILTRRNQEWLVVLEFLMLVVGHEILGALGSLLWLGFGWALLLGGTIVMTRRFIQAYLWY